jgi:hypothetical protein
MTSDHLSRYIVFENLKETFLAVFKKANFLSLDEIAKQCQSWVNSMNKEI